MGKTYRQEKDIWNDYPEYEYEKKTKKKVSKKRKHIQKIKDYEQLEHDRNAGEHSFYYR